jgi:hypothetical protein
LAYTRVLAVPRSIARSLASLVLPVTAVRDRGSAALGLVLGLERLHPPAELLDAGPHRGGPALVEPQNEGAQQAEHDGDEEEQERGHAYILTTVPLPAVPLPAR